ncbi:uncharacterized protein SCHCODRAFT_02330620 [Schizophyllum commune H4-8]|uniref:uncharacterized protein n=1 Tax=Schizophyllum commune (strain H4-8 / FGSC 9210) TaxID=578458 RepID=UPI00215FCF39|nr:uncharacterized protein SCHCODRAFT_02330620 [Schizophyllum commune H4-8]KAI5891854.1 hypothetical protein SCHCODRAFT_02330620 [Schizophyllum commune H4-8]
MHHCCRRMHHFPRRMASVKYSEKLQDRSLVPSLQDPSLQDRVAGGLPRTCVGRPPSAASPSLLATTPSQTPSPPLTLPPLTPPSQIGRSRRVGCGVEGGRARILPCSKGAHAYPPSLAGRILPRSLEGGRADPPSLSSPPNRSLEGMARVSALARRARVSSLARSQAGRILSLALEGGRRILPRSKGVRIRPRSKGARILPRSMEACVSFLARRAGGRILPHVGRSKGRGRASERVMEGVSCSFSQEGVFSLARRGGRAYPPSLSGRAYPSSLEGRVRIPPRSKGACVSARRAAASACSKGEGQAYPVARRAGPPSLEGGGRIRPHSLDGSGAPALSLEGRARIRAYPLSLEGARGSAPSFAQGRAYPVPRSKGGSVLSKGGRAYPPSCWAYPSSLARRRAYPLAL